MKLSYIVPVYKVEQYLHQCIDSILSQTMDDYEIILVDDGSPDSCPMICDEYKEKYPEIFNVIHRKNAGLAAARNSGLKVARGEYIFFFDSDDYLISDGVSQLYDKAKEYNADVLATTYVSFDEGKDDLYHSELKYESERIYSHSDMEKLVCDSSKTRRLMFVWRNLYKRDFLEKNNIVFNEELRMIEDSPFNMLAFLKAERFVGVDIPIYGYRHRADSLQRKKYVKDYDLFFEYQYNLKLKYYTENAEPRKEFFEDIAEYVVKSFLFVLLGNVYTNKIKERYSVLKRIGNSDMMRRSFKDYDIKKFKSKSLDWWVTWCLKYKLYPLAHLICDKILYK